MRRWILNIHMYGGLLCSSYLIIFGISSLNFNHHFEFAKPREDKIIWDRPTPLQPIHDKVKAAESIRDSLGLTGWPLPWKTDQDTNGNLHFDMERPGKSYTVHAFVSENRVQVEERRKGFWPVVNSLHALMSVPNSMWASGWGIFTEICTWVVLFSALSGIYLWAVSGRERRISAAILASALIGSIALLAYVRLRG